jgi:hypothetical protein
MPNTIPRIVAFRAIRHNALRGTHLTVVQVWCRCTPRHNLARAYLTIVNQMREFELSSADTERDRLDWLSNPHSYPDLAQACKEVLEHARTPVLAQFARVNGGAGVGTALGRSVKIQPLGYCRPGRGGC